MFRLEWIELKNFRSYVGEHRFEFPTSGLYFLTGKNLLEPALGSNGAGKSTFLDAITWCLYGRTTRGLKANEVLSWQVSIGAVVTLAVTVGDVLLTIKRTQKPNGLFVNDKPVDQKELETHLRLNYEAFTHSVLNPQFGEPFFSLLPSAKLALFSDINKLDFWLKKSDEATKLAKLQELELSALSSEISRFEGQLESIDTDIADLEVKSKNYEAERASKLASLEKEAVGAYKQIGKLNTKLTNLKSEKSELLTQIKLVNEDLADAVTHREQQLKNIDSKSVMKKEFKRVLSELESQFKYWDSAQARGCPECGRPVETQQALSTLTRIVRAIASKEKDVACLNKDIEAITGKLAISKGKIRSLTSELDELHSAMSDIDIAITQTKIKSAVTNETMDRIADNLQQAKMGTNVYVQLLDVKHSKRGTIANTLQSRRDDYKSLGAENSSVGYWIRGFRSIRLFIIEQAFQTLEIEVNNVLAELGMADWQVTFDIERENKSGGITKGFIVLIQGPSNPTPVRWENWSGGETQRLQLAGELGLANLIMRQAGLEGTIEFYDEPSVHLAPEGMMDLANVLYERATNEGKSIWVADHASIANFGGFDGIIEARKDKNGSTINRSGRNTQTDT